MPNRIIRDGILSSENVDLLDFAEEVFYRRLQSVADDHGRFYGNPKLIRAACYPLRLDRVSDSDVTQWVSACQAAGLIDRYTGSDGKNYLQIIKFGQRIQSRSKFPDPCKDVVHGEPPCATVENRLVVVEDGVGDGVDKEPKGSSSADTADHCPHDAIRSLFREVLPELAQPRTWTGTRVKNLRSRWREDPERQSLDWWRGFFEYVRKCPLLMGRHHSRDHPGWAATLDWLVKPENFAKVIDGKYEVRDESNV